MTSPSDNVVPIRPDLELERGNRRLRAYVIVLAAVWLAILTAAVVLTPLPDPVPLFALACIVVLAEHRFVLFGDETAVSSTMIVLLASTVIFADSAPLTGPMLVGAAGGLYVPHLLRGDYPLAAANASVLSLSGAASAVALTIPGVAWVGTTPIGNLVLAVGLFWVVNSLLIGSATTVRLGGVGSEHVKSQLTSTPELALVAAAAAAAVHGVRDDQIIVGGVLLVAVGLFDLMQLRALTRTTSKTTLDVVCGALALTLLAAPAKGSVATVGATIALFAAARLCARATPDPTITTNQLALLLGAAFAASPTLTLSVGQAVLLYAVASAASRSFEQPAIVLAIAALFDLGLTSCTSNRSGIAMASIGTVLLALFIAATNMAVAARRLLTTRPRYLLALGGCALPSRSELAMIGFAAMPLTLVACFSASALALVPQTAVCIALLSAPQPQTLRWCISRVPPASSQHVSARNDGDQ